MDTYFKRDFIEIENSTIDNDTTEEVSEDNNVTYFENYIS